MQKFHINHSYDLHDRHPSKLFNKIHQIIDEHTCEGRSKDKGNGGADLKVINTGLGLLSWYDTASNSHCYFE